MKFWILVFWLALIINLGGCLPQKQVGDRGPVHSGNVPEGEGEGDEPSFNLGASTYSDPRLGAPTVEYTGASN